MPGLSRFRGIALPAQDTSRLKTSISIAATLLIALASASAKPRELEIVAAVTVGERSRDSSSQTETITVRGRSLLWDKAFAGASRGRNAAAPARRRFTLTSVDRENLTKLAREGGLISTETIELRERPPLAYFVLKIETSAGREKGVVTISGPRSAAEIAELPLYRNSLALVRELYRIMQTQDRSIAFEEPLRALP